MWPDKQRETSKFNGAAGLQMCLNLLPPQDHHNLRSHTWHTFLGLQDPLEKEMAAHSSILAWRIPWTKEPGRLQSTESQELPLEVEGVNAPEMQPMGDESWVDKYPSLCPSVGWFGEVFYTMPQRIPNNIEPQLPSGN